MTQYMEFYNPADCVPLMTNLASISSIELGLDYNPMPVLSLALLYWTPHPFNCSLTPWSIPWQYRTIVELAIVGMDGSSYLHTALWWPVLPSVINYLAPHCSCALLLLLNTSLAFFTISTEREASGYALQLLCWPLVSLLQQNQIMAWSKQADHRLGAHTHAFVSMENHNFHIVLQWLFLNISISNLMNLCAWDVES